MKKFSNRREALQVLGAVGFGALVGCGDDTSGGGGSGGGSTGGNGGFGSGGTGIGGTQGGAGGSGAVGSGGTGAGNAGAGGAGTGATGSGGSGAGAAGGAGAGGTGSISCVARPQQTEGPYFVDEMLNRSDIRSDPTNGTVKAGVPLRVVMHVYRIEGASCTPLENALVDLWQCDALGVYAGVVDVGGQFDTTGQKFLRGYQLTAADGKVEFVTIYPGWYDGRTVHLHFKVRTDGGAPGGVEFTSQLYFDQTTSDQVLAQAPYNDKGVRDTTNSQDGIFQNAGGNELMLELTQEGDGYVGTFSLGLAIG